MSQVKRESCDENDDDIRFIESSEWTLETTRICSTIGDENAQGNESTSTTALLEAKAQLERLKEDEEKAKSRIQAIQEKLNEYAQGMTTRNAEHQKRKQELEEKCQKKIAKLDSKNMEENAHFSNKMTNLKEQLKEKVNWDQVELVMGKKLASPICIGNRWNLANPRNSISISMNGLNAAKENYAVIGWRSVSAEKGFITDFPGPFLHYFEVTRMSVPHPRIHVGLSSGNIPKGSYVGELPNSYAMHDGYKHYFLSGKPYSFEWPNGPIKPAWNWDDRDNVLGCGLLLSSENELSIFFTANGLLMGKQIPINSTADTLYPTISMQECGSFEANFGDNSAKPFSYDIEKCPGMIK